MGRSVQEFIRNVFYLILDFIFVPKENRPLKKYVISGKNDPEIFVPDVLWRYHILNPKISEDEGGINITGLCGWFGRNRIYMRINYI